MLPDHIQQLILQFTKLPGIGPRQAARFAFHLIRNREDFTNLISALGHTDKNVDLCKNCYLPASQNTQCSVCSNPMRDKNTLCIIEKETDAVNLEKSGHFKGHYYVLGGFINPLYPDNTANKRTDFFIKKLSKFLQKTESGPHSLEIILALTPRREGDFTSHYIEQKLKPLKERGLDIRISRLGRGLSSGAELEYADEETLKNAFEGRK